MKQRHQQISRKKQHLAWCLLVGTKKISYRISLQQNHKKWSPKHRELKRKQTLTG